MVTDAAGCADSAFVTVKVFKTIPYVFVPTAFTPNNDGRNDVIRPIAVGISKNKLLQYLQPLGAIGFHYYYQWQRMGWPDKRCVAKQQCFCLDGKCH